MQLLCIVLISIMGETYLFIAYRSSKVEKNRIKVYRLDNSEPLKQIQKLLCFQFVSFYIPPLLH